MGKATSGQSLPRLAAAARLFASFDGDAYLAANPDVAAAGVDSARHFFEYGAFEGRRAFRRGAAAQADKEAASADKDADFRINLDGVDIVTPNALLAPDVRRAFEEGVYERAEASIAKRMIRRGDCVLELGGAIGFMAVVLARAAVDGRVVSIEANPGLIDVARANHARNGVSVELRHGMVGAGEGAVGDFWTQANFLCSSNVLQEGERISVPRFDFAALVDEIRPDVLVVDIEGGERDLFDAGDLSGVRQILVEAHRQIIGHDGFAHMFESLARKGFVYDPLYSQDQVVGFTPRWAWDSAPTG